MLVSFDTSKVSTLGATLLAWRG